MTYPEVLDFLFSQLPMYQKVGKTAYKKDLSNTIKLCAALHNPHRKFHSIHIAGTNGKGSTAHMLAGILQAAGLKVGLYTSPHYRDYRERIKINGQYIAKKAVIDFVQRNQSILKSIQPSFFEMTVGLAFEYFARQKVDIAIIETGLGGRLDSTNIIDPLITVITNIGLDHQAMLGDTLELIAVEKAGIMKIGVPCIIGRIQEQTKEVFKRIANAKNVPLHYSENQLQTKILSSQIHRTKIEIRPNKGKTYTIDLPSGVSYNIENCQAAIATIQELNKASSFYITNRHIRDGLKDFPQKTKYIGRWHIKSMEPLILFDAAHNEEGIRTLFKALANYQFDQIHIILGMVNDKASEKILSLLPQDARYYFCMPDIPRGKNQLQLRSEALEFDLAGIAYVSCNNALKAAKRAAGSNDLILGTGSSFVVAELV